MSRLLVQRRPEDQCHLSAERVDGTQPQAIRIAAALYDVAPGLFKEDPDFAPKAQYQPDGSWGVTFLTQGNHRHVAEAGQWVVWGGDSMGVCSDETFHAMYERVMVL